jgi:hypothetical protein
MISDRLLLQGGGCASATPAHGGDGRSSCGPVFPQVRQWVLSLPKRLRYFLHHEPALIGPVLRIFLDAVEDRLKVSSPGALAEARFKAVTFVHRFGSALNANLHFHCASSMVSSVPTGKGCNFTKLGCSVLRTSPPCNARRVPMCCGSSRGAGSSRRRPRPRCGNGSTGVASLSMPWTASRPRTGRGWSACYGIVPARSLRASGCSGRSRPRAGDRDGPCMPRRGCSV